MDFAEGVRNPYQPRGYGGRHLNKSSPHLENSGALSPYGGAPTWRFGSVHVTCGMIPSARVTKSLTSGIFLACKHHI